MPTPRALTLLDRLAETLDPSVLAELRAELLADPLEDRGFIGSGGMGEVRRARDPGLGRMVARKALRAGLDDRPALTERFLQEARVTAQLQHPGIVPVYDLGTLPDGRPCFTMKEVEGRTLKEVVAEVHAASPEDRWEPAPSGWTFRRLIEAFLRVCEAVAYAHARGIVHRDLKPSNLMLGDFGEVLVVDWGLAAHVGEAPSTTPYGTPAYMPPEVARGQAAPDPRADVYALGAVLYHILSDRPPFSGHSGMVLERLRAGPPVPPGRLPARAASSSLPTIADDGSALHLSVRSETEIPPEAIGPFPSGSFIPAMSPGVGVGPPLPEPLLETCARAMARDPRDRYADARELGEEIGAWLAGLRLREAALAQVAAADQLVPEVEGLRARAAALRAEADAALERIPLHHPAEERVPWWRRQDEAVALELDAERAEVRRNQLLQAALAAAPDLPEAQERLADYHRGRLEIAEAARDWRAVLRHESDLRLHDRGRHAAWLVGDGALTLHTDPPGATVELYRYERVDRRLVPRFAGRIGPTPVEAHPLAMGSWLLILRRPGHAPVRYPVHIRRQEHWDGVPPGERAPFAIRLPRTGELGPEDHYVPAGWTVFGGDPEAHASAPAQRVWVPGFVARRFDVTVGAYAGWLNRLVDAGAAEVALRHAPRIPGVVDSAQLFGRDAQGRFFPQADTEGDVWGEDWPILCVDWFGARAFASAEAEHAGRPWRLPVEIEWEKAARGVDGRFLPWGDFHDPSWCNMRDSTAGRMLPVPVDRFPVDESPYELRGLGGNARNWCADAFDRAGPRVEGGRAVVPTDLDAAAPALVTTKGGTFGSNPQTLRCASRYMSEPQVCGYTGFRLVRSWG